MKIINAPIAQNKKYKESFQGKQRLLTGFISLKESKSSLSAMRLGQEFATNWFPKAIFARSFADLSEVSFLEFSENILVYIVPVLLANACKKLYSKVLPKALKGQITKQADELIAHKTLANKKLMPVKAAISITALAIPLAEYSLSYIKNMFTLKLFKQADFNNIANLNKNKVEDAEKQKHVKDSAKKHIKLASGLFAGCLALSGILLSKGRQSKALNHLSEAVLAPGSKLESLLGSKTKFFEKRPKAAGIINKYFGLDFVSKDGKLTMPNGMITACVTIGGFGYFGAAKDRGKQNFKEVLYRFPLVGLYAITGSELIETGFKKYLKKKEAYKDLFKNGDVPELSKLKYLANEVAQSKIKSGETTTFKTEYQRLFKQKSTVVMAPFLFGLGFMGLFVAGISRLCTQLRYNKEHKGENIANAGKYSSLQRYPMSAFGNSIKN